MSNYKAIEGQSIYDICLQTYGTLKYLFKLLTDNNIDNLNTQNLQNKIFIFDETLINDNSVYQKNLNDQIFYTTKHKDFVVFSEEDQQTIFISEDGTTEFTPEP